MCCFGFCLGTLTLEAALLLSGRPIGPAIATAANSIVVRAVSCMLAVVGLWVGEVRSECFELRTKLSVQAGYQDRRRN